MSEEKQVSDEEIIDVLHKIKQYCDEHRDCEKCMLSRSNTDCIFDNSVYPPCEWNLTPRTVIF